jgi:hypothetical protein
MEEAPRDEQGIDRTDAGPDHDDEPLAHFQALDAIASEQDMVLAFRVCEESQEFEPVFLRIMAANSGEEHETALISIGDERGLPLGRYVISRRRLEAALETANDVTDDDPEPSVVPSDWLAEPETPSPGISPTANEPPEPFDLPVPGPSTRLPIGERPARRHGIRGALSRGLHAMRHPGGATH